MKRKTRCSNCGKTPALVFAIMRGDLELCEKHAVELLGQGASECFERRKKENYEQ